MLVTGDLLRCQDATFDAGVEWHANKLVDENERDGVGEDQSEREGGNEWERREEGELCENEDSMRGETEEIADRRVELIHLAGGKVRVDDTLESTLKRCDCAIDETILQPLRNPSLIQRWMVLLSPVMIEHRGHNKWKNVDFLDKEPQVVPYELPGRGGVITGQLNWNFLDPVLLALDGQDRNPGLDSTSIVRDLVCLNYVFSPTVIPHGEFWLS